MKQITLLFSILIMACIAQAQSIKSTLEYHPLNTSFITENHSYRVKCSDTIDLSRIEAKVIKYNDQVYAVDSTGIHEPKQSGIFVLKLDAQTIQAIYGALDKSTENHQLIKALQEYLAAVVKRQQ